MTSLNTLIERINSSTGTDVCGGHDSRSPEVQAAEFVIDSCRDAEDFSIEQITYWTEFLAESGAEFSITQMKTFVCAHIDTLITDAVTAVSASSSAVEISEIVETTHMLFHVELDSSLSYEESVEMLEGTDAVLEPLLVAAADSWWELT